MEKMCVPNKDLDEVIWFLSGKELTWRAVNFSFNVYIEFRILVFQQPDIIFND